MNLIQAQTEWLSLHDDLRQKKYTSGACQLAAPFFSIPDPIHSNPASGPVMLVGQSTRECWFASSYENAWSKSLSERIEERRNITKSFLTDSKYVGARNTGFWRMWKNLKRKIEAPVIWSNAAKIGVLKGNPPPEVIEEQAELAICTLHAEIDEYKPQMLIFVTGYFARCEIVAPFLDEPKEPRDFIKDHRGVIYTRKRNQDTPAILWTGHPGRQSTPIVELWLDEAVRLLN